MHKVFSRMAGLLIALTMWTAPAQAIGVEPSIKDAISSTAKPAAAAPLAAPVSLDEVKPAAPRPAGDAFVGLPRGAPVPMKVGVAVFVNDIAKINEQAGTYEVNMDVRYRWRDPGLAFSAKTEGADRQEFTNEEMEAKLKKMWSPRLTISNQNGAAQRSEGGLFIYADGSVEHIQRMRVTLDNKYKLGAFPFDAQAMSIRVVSRRYSTNQLQLAQDQSDINASGVKETMSINGWAAKKLDFEAGASRGWSGDLYSDMEAKLTIKRLPYATLFAILTPFILTLLVPTIMTLYIKADVAPRMTLWGASILALIALNFTFSVRYAGLGSDSIVQQLITIGFGLQLLMVSLTVTVFNPQVCDKMMGKHLLVETIAFLRWGVPIGFGALIVTRALLTAFT